MNVIFNPLSVYIGTMTSGHLPVSVFPVVWCYFLSAFSSHSGLFICWYRVSSSSYSPTNTELAGRRKGSCYGNGRAMKNCMQVTKTGAEY